MNDDRKRFQQAALNFAGRAKSLPSVQEVILCGSMASDDPYPQDINLAVVLSTLDELPPLALFCRQISSVTHAWAVFVFNAGRKYLGAYATSGNVRDSGIAVRRIAGKSLI